nr:hypothetical protein [Bradyrhizobium neotropicale]
MLSLLRFLDVVEIAKWGLLTVRHQTSVVVFRAPGYFAIVCDRQYGAQTSTKGLARCDYFASAEALAVEGPLTDCLNHHDRIAGYDFLGDHSKVGNGAMPELMMTSHEVAAATQRAEGRIHVLTIFSEEARELVGVVLVPSLHPGPADILQCLFVQSGHANFSPFFIILGAWRTT